MDPVWATFLTMVIGQAYCCVCTKNAAIDPFFSYIGTTYSCVLKNTTIGFFFPPSITTSCYIPTSQVPNNKSRTTSSQHKIAKRYVYIYIYKFCTSQKIYRNDFFTFKTALKQPQTVSNNITNGTFYVKKNIYILTFVFTTCLECPQFHLLPFWTETLSCPLHGKTAQIILCQVKFAKFLLAIHNTLNMNLKL